ncbi:hypothetical protein FRC00_011789, partial [Tulasnella sp. 408]
MSAGNYTPLSTSEPSNDGAPSSWRGRSSFASAVPDGWLNLHSLKKSKPVVIALGVITLATVFVGTQFTIGEGGFDFRSAGKGGVVPEDVLVHAGLEGNGFSKKWGNVSDVSQFLAGPPANSIRANVIMSYVSWTAGTYRPADSKPQHSKANLSINLQVHVVYTAMLADRVAIIPPLTPDLAHVGGKPKQVPPINFGEIFDIPQLRKSLNWPVLEWSEVKKAAYDVPLSHETTPVDGVVMDELGCWGIRTVGNKGSKDPGHSVHEMLLQLGELNVGVGMPVRLLTSSYLGSLAEIDCSYTVLPSDALATPDNYHVKVWSMAAALFPDGRKRVLDANTARFPTQFGKKEWIAPDEQLAVFDNTYGVSAYVPYEWFQDFSPMWRYVGRYLRFTPRVEGIADEYLRRMFGIGQNDAIPL